MILNFMNQKILIKCRSLPVTGGENVHYYGNKIFSVVVNLAEAFFFTLIFIDIRDN